MKKSIKISLIIISSFLTFIFIIGFGMFMFYNFTTKFEPSKLRDVSLAIELYDKDGNIVREKNSLHGITVSLLSLPDYIPQAFISAEDKHFYKHKGLDYKRMIKATLVNLKSLKFKQGASTISQQLIKNTHLSNERTISRKLKEIILARKMEGQFSKNQILETYLNVICFGNNCYGIESAANYYFSKRAKDLTVSEVATLAGIITAPNRYSPTTSLQLSTKKRNIVLKHMLDDGFLNIENYAKLKEEPIKLNINKTNNNILNSYVENAIDEASSILNLPAKQIALGGYKIFTYLDNDKQEIIKETIKENNELLKSNDCAIIDIDIESGAVVAYEGKSSYKILSRKRQPGSLIKPIIVYGPAIDKNLISPSSTILDEEITIGNYTPQNITKNYSGNVTVRNALAKSLNIPAVKVLSYVGIEDAKDYAKKCGIDFNSKDNNYALALGGMTDGTSLKEITASYMALANQGQHKDCSFIKYITDSSGKIIYRHKNENKSVFREDTAYLVSDMLKSAVKIGTSRKLSDLNFDIASKTGTVGNNKGNSDAYNVSYTSKNIIGVWVGDLTHGEFTNITGGNQPSVLAQKVLAKRFKNSRPSDFIKPDSVIEIEIDLLELTEKQIVKKANSFTPDRYKTRECFSKFNEPKEISENFIKLDEVLLSVMDKEDKKYITFEAKDYIEYSVYKNINGQEELIREITNSKGIQEIEVDKKQYEKQSYYVISKIINFTNNVEIISQKSNEIKFMFNKTDATETSTKKHKWYI